MKVETIEQNYAVAKARYAEFGIDTDKAIAELCLLYTSYNPCEALPQRRFGLFPVRSPLLGESLFIFSSCGY